MNRNSGRTWLWVVLAVFAVVALLCGGCGLLGYRAFQGLMAERDRAALVAERVISGAGEGGYTEEAFAAFGRSGESSGFVPEEAILKRMRELGKSESFSRLPTFSSNTINGRTTVVVALNGKFASGVQTLYCRLANEGGRYRLVAISLDPPASASSSE